jgi:hypothetical protein
MGMTSISKRVLIYETLAFLLIVSLMWIDEIFDLPHLFLGAEPTPINWRESLFESILISILGLVVVCYTRRLFQKISYLEGILPICSYCKRIRDDQGAWQRMEEYISDKSEAEFSHGICPECAKKIYPQYSPVVHGSDPPVERPTTSVMD